MKWKKTRSDDLIDLRGGGGGMGGGRRGGMGGGMRLPMPGGGRGRVGGGLGVVGILLFLAVQLLGGSGGGGYAVDPGFENPVAATDGAPIPAGQDPDRNLRDFSEAVFVNAQDSWEKTFSAAGRKYPRAKLVLYRSGVSTGCGSASSSVGPFYCSADERVYLDLSFYNDMERQLRAGGDFAWAYVIAHEVAHHVQHVVGTSAEVSKLQREQPEAANPLSVRQELQADCYAGVWAHSLEVDGDANWDLQAGDLEEALTAAGAIGDDRLQRQSRGTVDPDSFTHGTSAQRVNWFRVGQRNGGVNDCDTFGAESL